MGLDKRYLFFGAFLALISFGVSLYFYPEWKQAWWLLIIAVVTGVIGFVSNFRQAFEKKDTEGQRARVSQTNISIEGSNAGRDIVTSTDNTHNIGTQINNANIFLERNPNFRPGSAPPRPSLMIGREMDIAELKGRLTLSLSDKASLQVLTAIKGWPGVGKTTIASALAHDAEIEKFFPDGVLWTSLGQEPNILSELAAWGRALGNDEILRAQSIPEAQSLLAGLLRNKRFLLIIDDVWRAEDAFPFQVGGSGCATLLTTRFNGIANAIAPSADSIYKLKVLSDTDAMELLGKLAPSVVNQYSKECLVLVQELEGLPLALQVAGRLLNAEANYGFGVTDLINDLRQGAKLLAATAPADRTDLLTETTPTIAALLQKSLDRLDSTTKECYAYLGVFAPKPATFEIAAMRAVWEMEDPAPVIAKLVDRGLLEYVSELGRYQMHALLVMLAKTLLKEEE